MSCFYLFPTEAFGSFGGAAPSSYATGFFWTKVQTTQRSDEIVRCEIEKLTQDLTRKSLFEPWKSKTTSEEQRLRLFSKTRKTGFAIFHHEKKITQLSLTTHQNTTERIPDQESQLMDNIIIQDVPFERHTMVTGTDTSTHTVNLAP
ncbi:hypothetical protein HOLleu_33548 [Holothuria leucospilota]|uniref:Uncharacterized protein n=1 Tax=Holothuria leucospilota TaxID=206669 RepID=A0A9Q0YNW7_HOLLE|nr:hypothetical protein HOLleu_33548 [Holothuria leucospilota]